MSQGIDSTDDQADVLITVHGMVDSLYVKELAKKTHRGLEGLVLRGLSAGGRCYGYATEPVGEGTSRRMVVNESEATIVRSVFKMINSPYWTSSIQLFCISGKELPQPEKPAA